MKNHLILITGPKHSGKSSCARALGKISGRKVLDLDECIEQQSGKTPRALFTEGPEIFMKAEIEALAFLLQLQLQPPEPTAPESNIQNGKNCLIVSLGGGIIDNNKAMELISKPGAGGHRNIIFVYLDVSAETAWQRILDASNAAAALSVPLPGALAAEESGLPPFLLTENPKETHHALHKRRAEAYKALAAFTVSAENKSPESIAGEIINYINGL